MYIPEEIKKAEKVLSLITDSLDKARELPTSRETALTITKLEEAYMWTDGLINKLNNLLAEIKRR